jgi:hypothetical protein
VVVVNKKPTILSWVFYGGGDRDRTGDLIVANDALSQLSYTPKSIVENGINYTNVIIIPL